MRFLDTKGARISRATQKARRKAAHERKAAQGAPENKALRGPAQNKDVSLDRVDFASPQARKAAVDAGLDRSHFARKKGSSTDGFFNVADVRAIAEAKK